MEIVMTNEVEKKDKTKAEESTSGSDQSQEMTLRNLFPKKVEIVIGIENPEIIKINPKLSFNKQIMIIPEMLEDLFGAFNRYRTDSINLKLAELESNKAEKQEKKKKDDGENKESALISDFMKIFKKNVFSILTLIIRIDEEKLKDASNDQLMYAIDIIFRENYEKSGKNALALRDRVRKIFQLRK